MSDGPHVLVVDVANLLGSRPDGWWRGPGGATQRLLDRLAGAGLGEVVAVVEGRAAAVTDVAGLLVVPGGRAARATTRWWGRSVPGPAAPW